MSERGKWVMADAPIAVFAIRSTPSDRSRHYISCRRSQRDKPSSRFQPRLESQQHRGWKECGALWGLGPAVVSAAGDAESLAAAALVFGVGQGLEEALPNLL
jgi:hypothetical protein